MTNTEIAKIFKAIAELLQLQGAEVFRVRSYERAAQAVESLTDDLGDLRGQGRLESVPGIGKALAAKIEELLDTGELEFYRELLAEVPPGLVQMIEIPELGPKTARRLYEELGIDTVEKLEEAARGERIRALKGFGARSEEKLLNNLQVWRRGRERVLSAKALAVAEPLVETLTEVPGVLRVSLAGSLRRGRDTAKDIDLLVATEDGAAAVAAFVAHPLVEEVTGQGSTKASARVRLGLNADLRVVPPASWGAALCYFTGSKAHNIALRARARERGLSLNEYGFTTLEGEASGLACASEEEVYAALGLPWIAPELREDRGELAAAESGELPALVQTPEVRGDLHVHSRWSDGAHSITQMAEAARQRGYEYLAICDHSKVLAVANGLDERRVREQWTEIAQAQAQVPEVRLLRGIEVDILADGSLDLEHDLLAELDLVVGSVHSAFGMDTASMTARLLAAVGSGVVDILGHPTGRMLRHREGYTFDADSVFAACAEAGVALEINAAPERLDLDDVLARRARRRGALLAVNTDAHSIAQLDNLEHGVRQARRAWVTAPDLINTRPLDELLAWLKD